MYVGANVFTRPAGSKKALAAEPTGGPYGPWSSVWMSGWPSPVMPLSSVTVPACAPRKLTNATTEAQARLINA